MQNPDIGTVFEQYSRQILNLTYSYVKDWGIAEDLTQEVFIKAADKLADFEQRSSLKTWLYRIAINHCKDFRKKRYLSSTFLTARVQEFFRSSEPSAEMATIKRSQKQLLAEKIMKLPIKYREIIILYYYEDLTVSEIGKLLGIKEPTIKSRLQRGRAQLVALLDGGDFE